MQNPGANKQQANNKGQVAVPTQEAIKDTTRSMFLFLQVCQSLAILQCLAVIKWGKESWAGTVFPDPGTFAAVALIVLFVSYMWVKNIDSISK